MKNKIYLIEELSMVSLWLAQHYSLGIPDTNFSGRRTLIARRVLRSTWVPIDGNIVMNLRFFRWWQRMYRSKSINGKEKRIPKKEKHIYNLALIVSYGEYARSRKIFNI